MVAQFSESLRTKVGELMVLPVSPDVLHGVKLRSIGRQVLKTDGAGLFGHKVFNQATTVGFGAIPNHHQLSFNVTLKMGEKLNDLGASNTARMQLKVKVPPGNPGYRRKLGAEQGWDRVPLSSASQCAVFQRRPDHRGRFRLYDPPRFLAGARFAKCISRLLHKVLSSMNTIVRPSRWAFF